MEKWVDNDDNDDFRNFYFISENCEIPIPKGVDRVENFSNEPNNVEVDNRATLDSMTAVNDFN